jgi:hypothetical protein
LTEKLLKTTKDTDDGTLIHIRHSADIRELGTINPCSHRLHHEGVERINELGDIERKSAVSNHLTDMLGNLKQLSMSSFKLFRELRLSIIVRLVEDKARAQTTDLSNREVSERSGV